MQSDHQGHAWVAIAQVRSFLGPFNVKAITFQEPGLGHKAAGAAYVEYADHDSCRNAFYTSKNLLMVEGLQVSILPS